MPRFDRTPTNEKEKRELIYEIQKLAASEGIQLTYADGNVDEKGELISFESNIMDTPQCMTFRDLDTKEERLEYLDYINFLNKECYLINFGFNEKLNKMDYGFKYKRVDMIVDFSVWKEKFKEKQNA